MSPTPAIGILLRELGPDSLEVLWLAAAARASRELPLAISPFLSGDGDAFYQAVDHVARELEAPGMREAEEQLDRCLAILERTAPRPADFMAPSDSANALYTPKIDAAYFVGLAMGVRLARALEAGGAGGAK